MATSPLSRGERWFLRLQRVMGWLFFSLVVLGSWITMRIIRNNRINPEHVRKARAIYAAALKSGRPTLVCANHLTMVDSAYLHWAFAPLWSYWLNYRKFSWNVAAIEHLTNNKWLRLICFLGKVVPIDRGGDDDHRKKVVQKLQWLVQSGEILTMFPEGSRSRTGFIDVSTVTYGVGQILRELDRPQVLCAYLRAPRQVKETGVPPYGDILDLDVQVIEPATQEQGLRAIRDLSRQIIGKLKSMEDEWLARRGTSAVVKA